MYAVIEQGKKQFKVEKGAFYKVDKMLGEKGGEVSFKNVLLVADGEKSSIGAPYVEGAEVKCTIVGEAKGKKVVSLKFRRRKASKVKKGHRQKYTVIKVEDIIVE